MKTIQEMLDIKELTAVWVLDQGALPVNLNNRGWLKELMISDKYRVVSRAFQGEINWSDEVVDGWGTPFRIQTDGKAAVRVRSAGPDKTFGTPDDITNQ